MAAQWSPASLGTRYLNFALELELELELELDLEGRSGEKKDDFSKDYSKVILRRAYSPSRYSMGGS